MHAVCRSIIAIDAHRLRPWHQADAPLLFAAWEDPEIARWNPVPPDASVSFAETWIRGTATQNEASVGIDVVMVDATDVVRGEVGLQIDPVRGIAEIGFWLHQGSRGHGYGKTLLALAEGLADRLDIVGLVALTEPDNRAAVGLLDAVGWNEVPTTSKRRAFARRIATAGGSN